MVTNQILIAEYYKPYKIRRSMCNMYGEICFSQKMSSNVLNCLKEVKIVFKMKIDQTNPLWQTPEMVDSVNALILLERRVSIEISEQLRISVRYSTQNCA